MIENASVLVVEPDAEVAGVVASVLDQARIATVHVPSEETALEALVRRPLDAVLVDLDLPDSGALGLLRGLRERWPDLPLVMLASRDAGERAVESLRLGAADYALVPIERDDLLYAVRKALALARHAEERPPEAMRMPARLVAASPAMQDVVHVLDRAAHGSATVLLTGEPGSGKALAARTLHESGPRADGPFVRVHCGALPDGLLEAELFGYAKGAFAGAANAKPGRAELAHGGTLFLDGIDAVSPVLQVKLLRLLQDRQLERVGSHRAQEVDVRFVAASSRRLEGLVAEGRFREDLYYRLNVIHVDVPPLRERREDIAPLARRFLEVFAAAHGRPDLTLTDEALVLLQGQSWPGNVRQLQGFVERLSLLCDGPTLDVADVDRELTRAPVFAALARSNGGTEALRTAERRTLERALERAGGDRTVVARILGVGRGTLYRRLAEHDLLE